MHDASTTYKPHPTRDNHWRVQTSITLDGKRYQPKSILKAKTRTIRRVADEWAADTLDRVRREHAAPAKPKPIVIDGGEPTFGYALRRYVETTSEQREWSEHYTRATAGYVRRILDSPLADVRLVDLTDEQLVAHVKAYRETPTQFGKRRGDASIRHLRVLLAATVDYCNGDRQLSKLIEGDPAKGLSTLDKSRTVAERDIPDVLDFRRRLDRGCDAMAGLVASDVHCRVGYEDRAELVRDLTTVALLAGLRRAELCGLQSRDVEHHASGRATVHVRRVVNRLPGGQWETNRTKNRRDRVIEIGEVAARILFRRASENDALALSYGLDPSPESFVFSRGWGDEPLMPDAISQWWVKLRSVEKSLAGLRFQDLRHACASQLHASGHHAAGIAAFMGHTTAVSLMHYDHVRPGSGGHFADVLDAALVAS